MCKNMLKKVLGWGLIVDKAPRLSIRIDIWILLSDTETSAATPLEGGARKVWPNKVTSGASILQENTN